MSESALRRWALRNLVVADGPRAGRPFRIASAPWGDVLDAMDNPTSNKSRSGAASRAARPPR